MTIHRFPLSGLLLLNPGTIAAAEPAATVAPPSADVLLKTTTSWDGGGVSYPAGNAEITIVRMTMAQDQEVPLHCHPVPTFGVMLKGKLQVTTESGQRKLLSAGEPIVEVMKTMHSSRVIEGPAEFIVFYAGAEGVENTQPASAGGNCERD
ncbi:MAG: cupin domain-containing protein [Chromatiales bacterium]|nr:MAG: cupin domain-containing protein [Chromatiales bacterium]